MSEARARVVIRGGRDPQSREPPRGQDVGVFVVTPDGTEVMLPVVGLTLSVRGRHAKVWLDIEVDDVDVTGALIDSVTRSP